MLNHPLTQMPTHMPTLLVCGNLPGLRVSDSCESTELSTSAWILTFQLMLLWIYLNTTTKSSEHGHSRSLHIIRESDECLVPSERQVQMRFRKLSKIIKAPAFVLSDGISMHNSSPSMILREIFINILMISSMKVPLPSPRYD